MKSSEIIETLCMYGSHDIDIDTAKLPQFLASNQRRLAWRSPDGTQHLFCWLSLAISGQSLTSNGPVVDSTYLTLAFGDTEATHNILFPSSSTKYTVEPSCPLILI
ncbi:hypothetical protein TNCV_954701 [Trichonephila clavipes]|nr:hypothetical protein TNCV_954701 [Trichonephila clavipes]